MIAASIASIIAHTECLPILIQDHNSMQKCYICSNKYQTYITYAFASISTSIFAVDNMFTEHPLVFEAP